MNLRGIEVLVGTLGAVLLVLTATSGLTLAAVGWALAGLAVVLLGEAAVVRKLLPYYGTTRRWARIAAHLPGVRLLGDGGRTPPRLRGTLQSCCVRIDRARGGWTIAVHPIHRDEHVDVQLSLRSATGQRNSIRTGDPAFDRCVEVSGSMPDALLVLGTTQRSLILEALQDGIAIRGDRVEWTGTSVGTTAAAVQRLGRMENLARTLFAITPDELRWRALKTIVLDDEDEVRARTLWLYQDHYVLTPFDESCLRDMMDAPPSSLTLAVAGALVGVPDCASRAEATLAEVIARGEAPSWALAAAFGQLLEHGRPDMITAAVQARLRDDGPLPVEIFRWARAQGRLPAARILGERLCRAPAGDAIAAIDALGMTDDDEETLLALLDHEADGVVDRVLNGLAFLGSDRAVQALRRVARSSRRPRRIRHAATDALTAVQARRPRGSGGRLSLVEPSSPVGRLSVSD